MKKYILYISILSFCFNLSTLAQKNKIQNNSQIALMPRTAKDSITLRWVMSDINVFKKGLQNGYVINRSEQINGKFSKFKEVARVKPWLLSKWNNRLESLKDTTKNEYKYFKMAYELVVNGDSYLPTDLSDLQAIQLAKAQNELTFLFALIASCNDQFAAEAMGLRYTDYQVVENTSYKYQIEPINNSKNEEKLISEVEAKAETNKVQPLVTVNVIENEKSIGLNWLLSEEPYIGYSIERSQDNGKTYIRLNKEIILVNEDLNALGQSMGTLVDTNVHMYKPYIYKIIGHTLFADEALVGTARGMARDRTPVSSIFVPSPEPTGNNSAIIKWRLTAPNYDLKGFNIRRDNNPNGNFEKILNSNILSQSTTQFKDITFNNNEPNYYIVETIDTAGNTFRSGPVYLLNVDSFAPSSPVFIKGTVDTNGIVTLQLKLNPENDFMGYRIQKANQEDHEFSTFFESYKGGNDSLLIKSTDSIFYDTISLNTLTKHIYYRAYALDFHYNQSTPSIPIKLSRPDIIPPVTPIISNISVNDTSLILKIIPSVSEDVKACTIFRKIAPDTSWIAYDTIAPNKTTYIDTCIKTGNSYMYAIQAKDSSGLLSTLSVPKSGRPYDTGIRKGVDELKAQFDNDSKEIVLSWNYKSNYIKTDETVTFIVYRSVGTAPLERYKSIPYSNGTFFYKESDLQSKGPYNYGVKVITNTGGESELSNTLTVTIP